ncbi:Chitin synthase, class 7 [Monascus purpureus]|uniref:Chitin synthase export chaperone n=1 Tax=Monascus purpureus TaxID=5098 RepID=A0A507QWT3_MONPU|nr:Chitin synthase, class 7 [Monascus purpureus]
MCSLVGSQSSISGETGIIPHCYSRNIELANTIIFEGAASFIHIIALITTVIMILHVRSKFTAVGRREMVTFFYLYMLVTMCSLLLDAGVVPPGSGPFPYFVAVQNGLANALFTCLVVNGFVGFQLYEDGTALSVWLLRITSTIMFAVSFIVSLLTFKDWGGLKPTDTVGLFVVLYILNPICIVIYLVMQILLVLNTLEDRWPLGNIISGVAVFAAGQALMYGWSDTICDRVQHYLDGLFFSTLCNLFAVMMIYKYWDSITKEDLEFSVGVKPNTWEVKDLVPDDDRRLFPDSTSEYAPSIYRRASSYNY